jgi:hypothetical protein
MRHPVLDRVPPEPALPVDRPGADEHGHGAVELGEDRLRDLGEIGVAVVEGEGHRAPGAPGRGVVEQRAERAHRVAMPAQVRERRPQDSGRVPAIPDRRW